MRILVLASEWFPERAGGNARVAREVALGLAERGHEVTALAPARAGAPREEVHGSLTLRRLLPDGPLPATWTHTVAGWRWSRRGGERFDVVLAHTSTVLAGARRAGLRTPTAVVFHAPGPAELRLQRERLPRYHRKRLGAPLLIPVLAALERSALQGAARILTLSGYTERLVAAAYPHLADRVVRVGGGVDVVRFSPGERASARRLLGLEPDRRLILSVRRLEPRMGLETLLEATRELPPDVVVAVVGRGSLEPELGRRARAAGLEERFRLIGGVSDEQLPSWYRAADLFVLPTLAYEGFGMVTLEALACATPVVGTDVGATPELIGPLDPELVAPANQPAGLASAIRRALADPDPERLRARCRLHAESFAWQRVIVRWEAALEQAASR
jgi:glycosyltransferase involved in cell wall biosynthesis